MNSVHETRTLGSLTLDGSADNTIAATPDETIDAAAAAGFTSAGVRITGRRKTDDPFPSLLGSRVALSALRQRAAERGVRIANVTGYQLYADVTQDDMKRLVDATVALGSPALVAICHESESASLDRLGRYAELAIDASIRIAVEFMRYSTIKSVEHALHVLELVDSPAIGLLVDPLHLARSGGTPEQVRQIAPDRIVFAQLCDAKAHVFPQSDHELRVEARSGRLFPGDGELPLRELLAALPPGIELEYEVPRKDLGALSLTERARVAYSVFHSYLGDLPQPVLDLTGRPLGMRGVRRFDIRGGC